MWTPFKEGVAYGSCYATALNLAQPQLSLLTLTCSLLSHLVLHLKALLVAMVLLQQTLLTLMRCA